MVEIYFKSLIRAISKVVVFLLFFQLKKCLYVQIANDGLQQQFQHPEHFIHDALISVLIIIQSTFFIVELRNS